MVNCDKYRFDEKMFHVKHFCKIILALSIIMLSYKNVNVYAADFYIDINNSSNTNFAWIEFIGNSPKWYLVYNSTDTTFTFEGNNMHVSSVMNLIFNNYEENYDPTPPFMAGTIRNYTYTSIGTYQTIYNVKSIYIMKGTFEIVKSGNSNVDIVDYTKNNDPWYKKLWSKIYNELDDENTKLKNFVLNIGETISNFWKKITGDLPEHDGAHGKFGVADLATPTPFPSPTPRPTPIPYSTVIHDDGNGNSSIFYQYTNPEGTPTESPINPNINYNFDTNINFTGGDRNNPIYVQDVGNPQFTSIIDLSDNTISVNIGNLDDSIDMVADPLAESAQDIPIAVGGFSAIPDDLMIIIGCMACIPLIAGIIGRFLK